MHIRHALRCGVARAEEGKHHRRRNGRRSGKTGFGSISNQREVVPDGLVVVEPGVVTVLGLDVVPEVSLDDDDVPDVVSVAVPEVSLLPEVPVVPLPVPHVPDELPLVPELSVPIEPDEPVPEEELLSVPVAGDVPLVPEESVPVVPEVP